MAKSEIAAARHAAVMSVYDKINATYVDHKLTMPRADVAAEIRTLAGLSKSPRWIAAVEQYAILVEDTDNSLPWAYMQGSVWFSYAVEGLV